MTRQEIFFEEMNKLLNKEGFKYLKSKNSFSKKILGNEYILEFESWPYFAQIETNIKIILEQVEVIKKQAWGKKYDKFATLGNSKSYLYDPPIVGNTWTDTEENVYKAVEVEFNFYLNFAKEYFNKHTDIYYLNEKLNKFPGEFLYLSYNPANTIYLALIVAYLTKNNRIEELIIIYKKIILEKRPASINKYNMLVDFIKYNCNL